MNIDADRLKFSNTVFPFRSLQGYFRKGPLGSQNPVFRGTLADAVLLGCYDVERKKWEATSSVRALLLVE